MDMSQYYGLFISEAREHVRNIATLVVLLENNPSDRPTIDELFRSAHSVKGMAASMDFGHIASLAHKMEDLMDRVRRGKCADKELLELLIAGSDTLATMITELEESGVATISADDLVARIAAYSKAAETPAVVKLPVQPAFSGGEEKSSPSASVRLGGGQTVRIKTGILDSFVNTAGELLTVRHRLESLAKSSRDPLFADAVKDLGRHLRELQDHVMTARLIPLAAIAERFPRMVRDLAKKSGKEIMLTMTGVDIELDRSILELLGDPLSHILRNCTDHGIETMAERVAAGKPPSGTISITVVRNKDKLEITITDDGRGMEADNIAEAAVARGILSAGKARLLTATEKLMLICQPGFSTAKELTEISGRGVGMDVVKSTLQSLGGILSIKSTPGKETSFGLILPLTIAIINVLIVSAGGLTLAVPLTGVLRTLELNREEIAIIDGKEVIFLDGDTLPLIPLRQFLYLHAEKEENKGLSLIVAEIKGRRVALIVDRLIGQREVFVKSLGRPLSLLAGINGATMLGDGEIVFILDILNIG